MKNEAHLSDLALRSVMSAVVSSQGGQSISESRKYLCTPLIYETVLVHSYLTLFRIRSARLFYAYIAQTNHVERCEPRGLGFFTLPNIFRTVFVLRTYRRCISCP